METVRSNRTTSVTGMSPPTSIDVLWSGMNCMVRPFSSIMMSLRYVISDVTAELYCESPRATVMNTESFVSPVLYVLASPV